MSFKTAIQEYGKEITASFVCNGVTYSDDQIVSMIPHYEGKLFSSVMRCLDIQLDRVKYIGGVSGTGGAIVGKAIAGIAVVGSVDSGTVDGGSKFITSPTFGVKTQTEPDYNYKTYGTYIIKSQKYDDDSSTLNLECYDLMLQSMVPYDLALDYGNESITVKGLLDAICVRMGWTIGYDTFTNSDVVIDGEKFSSAYTFRDVLDQIAQVAAGVIAFKDDALCVLYPTPTGEIIDTSNLRTLSVGEKYGPINSVVLARTPQEDNIYKIDESSATENGITEVKIANNQIMDSHREDFIDAILERLSGLEFWLYELESFGIGYLDLCDMFTLEDKAGVQYKTLMLTDDFQISQSINENSSLTAPEATETEYKTASSADKAANETSLQVDKQAQEITALVRKTDNVASEVEGLATQVTNMAELMVTPESVDIKISQAVDGIDSVKTSTGYTFDENGLNISRDGDAIQNRLDNTGMYVSSGDEEILSANYDGVSAKNLSARQFLIVGGNSRFEDYDNGTDHNRTACFFIGGE